MTTSQINIPLKVQGNQLTADEFNEVVVKFNLAVDDIQGIYNSGLDPLSLDSKVDKIEGKSLSTEDYTTLEKDKLSTISPNANNYIHPVSHIPSIIVQDINNRFVTDAEKSTWNNKVDKVQNKSLIEDSEITRLASVTNQTLLELGGELAINKKTSITDSDIDFPTGKAVKTSLDLKVDKVSGKILSSNDYSTEEKNKLSSISENANNYIHPGNHLPSIITQDENNRFVTDIEKNVWNNKQSASSLGTDVVQALKTKILSTTPHIMDVSGNTLLDLSLSQIFVLTLTGDTTLVNPTTLVVHSYYTFDINQDSNGLHTLSWGSNFKFPNGEKPVLSLDSNAFDMFSVYVKSENQLIVTYAQNFI